MTIPNGSTGLTCANGPLSHKRPSLVHLDPTLLLWTLASAKLFGVLLLNFWIDKHTETESI